MTNQTTQLELFFSYACRDTYEVFAWLRQVQAQGIGLNITWSPFAIQIENPLETWERPWPEANSELRGFMAAEAARRQGEAAFRRFHNALEAAVHEQLLELGEEETLAGAARQANLDMARFQADLRDPAMAQLAQRSHRRAVEQFNVFGTPTLVFSNGQALHLELAEIPPKAEAAAMFQSVVALAVEQPYLAQLKRTTPVSTS